MGRLLRARRRGDRAADRRPVGGGADPIVSFGGAINEELARTCTSVASLAAQYQAVIDRYGIHDLDFDIEGADQSDATSLDRRFNAIAQIQAAGLAAEQPVHVSLTLPVLPTGLTHDGLGVVETAIADGVDVGTVNVMAMDYFDPSLDYAREDGRLRDPGRHRHPRPAGAALSRADGRGAVVHGRGDADDRDQRRRGRGLHHGRRRRADRLRDRKEARTAGDVVAQPGRPLPGADPLHLEHLQRRVGPAVGVSSAFERFGS